MKYVIYAARLLEVNSANRENEYQKKVNERGWGEEERVELAIFIAVVGVYVCKLENKLCLTCKYNMCIRSFVLNFGNMGKNPHTAVVYATITKSRENYEQMDALIFHLNV